MEQAIPKLKSKLAVHPMHEPLPLQGSEGLRPCSMFCTATMRRVARVVLEVPWPGQIRQSIPAPKLLLSPMPSTMGRCSSGGRAIRYRRNSFEAADNPDWVVAAHNDRFETADRAAHPRTRGTVSRSSRSSGTAARMAAALALGLPARLDRLADALELANRKDEAGESLMHQMSKPRRPA